MRHNIHRNIHRRLEDLEDQVSPSVPEIPLENEIEGVYETWHLHACGYTVGLFTDREINTLAALYVFQEIPGPGNPFGAERLHRFPSGAVVEWTDNQDGTVSAYIDGDVQVEDLPERISKNVDRMDPLEQPARERYLREHPLAYSDHILGCFKLSKTKKPPRYIPASERGTPLGRGVGS